MIFVEYNPDHNFQFNNNPAAKRWREEANLGRKHPGKRFTSSGVHVCVLLQLHAMDFPFCLFCKCWNFPILGAGALPPQLIGRWPGKWRWRQNRFSCQSKERELRGPTIIPSMQHSSRKGTENLILEFVVGKIAVQCAPLKGHIKCPVKLFKVIADGLFLAQDLLLWLRLPNRRLRLLRVDSYREVWPLHADKTGRAMKCPVSELFNGSPPFSRNTFSRHKNWSHDFIRGPILLEFNQDK